MIECAQSKGDNGHKVSTAPDGDIVTAATADLRRTQCADAATARLQKPLPCQPRGLGDSGEATRRAKCLEAAVMRLRVALALPDRVRNERFQRSSRARGEF